ncbi:hypothetical protein [Chamaesiphon sp.]|uniref:hypothetical protein n=1 Tax=Chamaesiphon sp. TaxID=2814140 RepID=UPI00359331B1
MKTYTDDDNLAIDIVSSYAIKEGKDTVEAVYHSIDWYHSRAYGTSYYEADGDDGGHTVHIEDKTFLGFVLENRPIRKFRSYTPHGFRSLHTSSRICCISLLGLGS